LAGGLAGDRADGLAAGVGVLRAFRVAGRFRGRLCGGTGVCGAVEDRLRDIFGRGHYCGQCRVGARGRREQGEQQISGDARDAQQDESQQHPDD
jgi:hypothetical protein